MSDLRFEPLIARHHGDAQDFCLWRLNQQEHRLLISSAGPGGILIDDDFSFLSPADEGSHQEHGGCDKTNARNLHHHFNVAKLESARHPRRITNSDWTKLFQREWKGIRSQLR